MRKFLAFTLGEVLIALGVIGVVAALIIPMLINGHKAAVARAQFDTAYSMVTKAIADMDADNVSVEPATYSAAQTFYPVFRKYNKIAIDRNTWSSASYSRFSGVPITDAEKTLLDDGSFIVNNGMRYFVENKASSSYGLLITVDINGDSKKPNRYGYDVFVFELVKGGYLLPLGAPETGTAPNAKNLWGKDEATAKTYCDQSSDNAFSGMTCAYEAAMDKEYFKKLYHGH